VLANEEFRLISCEHLSEQSSLFQYVSFAHGAGYVACEDSTMSNDVATEQATILQLKSKEETMRLLLLYINERVDRGLARCPTCSVAGNQSQSWGNVMHYAQCPFATLINTIA
jgi:hypothetical protein